MTMDSRSRGDDGRGDYVDNSMAGAPPAKGGSAIPTLPGSMTHPHLNLPIGFAMRDQDFPIEGEVGPLVFWAISEFDRPNARRHDNLLMGQRGRAQGPALPGDPYGHEPAEESLLFG